MPSTLAVKRSKVQSFAIQFPTFQEAEKWDERRPSRVRIGNSHPSVIDSTTSLYSNEERRSSSRLGSTLPPLIDEKECHHTVVRISHPSVSGGFELTEKSEASELEESRNEPNRTNSSQCGKGGTWFHFNLCLGMLGFVIFWLFLMLRIYLPESYWTWSYIW